MLSPVGYQKPGPKLIEINGESFMVFQWESLLVLVTMSDVLLEGD